MTGKKWASYILIAGLYMFVKVDPAKASYNLPSTMLHWGDTASRIGTFHDIATENQCMRDSIAVLRALINSSADTNNKVLYYGTSGRISNRIKKWVGIVTPSSATDQTIDISTAGFNTVLYAKIDAVYNGNLIWCQPNVVNTTQITLDLYRPNTSLVTILGLNVLQGVPFLTGNDLSNIRLHVEVTGY